MALVLRIYYGLLYQVGSKKSTRYLTQSDFAANNMNPSWVPRLLRTVTKYTGGAICPRESSRTEYILCTKHLFQSVMWWGQTYTLAHGGIRLDYSSSSSSSSSGNRSHRDERR